MGKERALDYNYVICNNYNMGLVIYSCKYRNNKQLIDTLQN